MANVIVTRHGETIWNSLNKVCGKTDIDLTKLGEEQANILGESLKEKNISLIISSPMIRAFKTATIVANKIGYKKEIIKDDRIRELDYGIFEGRSRDEEEYLHERAQFAARFVKGESVLELTHRVYSFLDDIKGKYRDENILVVSHNGVGRVIHTYFFDLDNKAFKEFSYNNCQFREYDLKDR